MTGFALTKTRRGAEAALRRALEESAVPRLAGHPARVRKVRRERSVFATSYAAEVLTVELEGERTLRVFLKDFGFSNLSKDAPESRRDRELRVYRDLLDGAQLGPPAYCGSVWDEEAGRFWLLLELVEGTAVRYLDVEHWVAAAGWLGRLQGFFRTRAKQLDGCPELIRQDRAFFERKVELARREVASVSHRARRRLDELLTGYEDAIEVMAGQPLTLVHGAYRPANILIGVNGARSRISPVDWELAAVGPAQLDLAFFSDGFDEATQERMYEAYAAEAEPYDLRVAPFAEAVPAIACFRLHRVVNWLSGAREKGYPESEVLDLIAYGEDMKRRVA